MTKRPVLQSNTYRHAGNRNNVERHRSATPILPRLAHSQNRRDEEPNVALAKELAAARDTAGIREVAEELWDDEAEIQNDCIKVL